MKTDYIQQLPPHWETAAKVFEALGSPVRQRILLLFEEGEELTIKQIADLYSFSRTSILFHLKALEQANLLLRRREGREVYLRLNKEPLLDALSRVQKYVTEEV
ncbi:MAG TPA: metalloregulator ArsR/SmtB family transcription factor [Cellvibrio sp.]|nr:metalloregulator ArsR/SmtB family transcription factor [Cellvibrio sp.]